MTTAETRSLNRWLTVGGSLALLMATVGCSLLGWMALSINSLSQEVVAIRTELDLVKPADVLDAVRVSESKQLRPRDVEQIVAKSAPWVEERAEWNEWRRAINERVRSVELSTE